MITNIDLSEKWLQFESGLASLHIQSFMEGIKSQKLSKTVEYLIYELSKMGNTNEVIELLSEEEFYPISLVFKSPEITILKSDSIRSVPLFYTVNNNQMYLSDQNNPRDTYIIDEDSIIEMFAIGSVLEDRTVYKNIFGVQAAEIIIFKDGKITKDRFFKYDVGRAREKGNQLNVYEHAVKLDEIFNKVFREIVESIPDEGRIVVPLSGGHDSRMVVNYLYKSGFKRVLCYSYGMPGNIQSKLSRQVAEMLGYEWHFIEYTDEKWEEVHRNGDFDDFIKYAFNGVSNPHLQDFLAVYELKKNGILKSEDVFITGHGLDFLSEIIDHSIYGKNIANAAVKYYCRTKEMPADINKFLHRRYAKIFKSSGASEISFLDYLFWQERASKFLFNSLRVYKFYGYSVRIPFWDIRLINFWLDIALEFKKSREFLFEMENEFLITQQLRGIPYASNSSYNEKKKKNIKEYIPNSLKVIYLRISKRKQPQGEGLNLIYGKKAKSVSELIGSTDKWPKEIINGLGSDLKRYPYQINYHFLTRLYTINKLLKD